MKVKVFHSKMINQNIIPLSHFSLTAPPVPIMYILSYGCKYSIRVIPQVSVCRQKQRLPPSPARAVWRATFKIYLWQYLCPHSMWATTITDPSLTHTELLKCQGSCGQQGLYPLPRPSLPLDSRSITSFRSKTLNGSSETLKSSLPLPPTCQHLLTIAQLFQTIPWILHSPVHCYNSLLSELGYIPYWKRLLFHLWNHCFLDNTSTLIFTIHSGNKAISSF